ncbi:MAG TPA: NAD+ synthase, partial [Spirochaetota bacterium]
MKIACAQINQTIADVSGNTRRIIDAISHARSEGADLVVFPELSTVGYPPMDLLEHTKLIKDNLRALEEIASASTGIGVICGYVDFAPDCSPALYNSAAFMTEGKIISRHFKSLLPTYDVFDEHRYFSSATERSIVQFKGETIGITICEDIWNDPDAMTTEGYIEGRTYPVDPIDECVQQGASIIINLSASPFVKGKNDVKRARVTSLAKKYHIPIVYVNQIGGNDSLLFDGGSFMVNREGKIVAMARLFEEDLLIGKSDSMHEVVLHDEGIDTIENALVMGVKDYCRKCGFKGAVLGLSGGIDSALTAAIAVKALGKENVLGVTMPSVFSSKGSVDDSFELARNLGIRIETIPIRGLYDEYNKDLLSVFEGRDRDVTEENLQARIRGTILMALSNKFGHILLSTGNKSELAMGYCTLYGDMNGGLAVISDLPKVLVYALSRHINHEKEIIPQAVIEKAPSAELRENQKDQDSLPPYDILDGILELYIEKRFAKEEIIRAGYDAATVEFVLRTVDRNEYKRRQAAPGLKVTTKAFGF